MNGYYLLLCVSLLVGSISAAITMRRKAAARRSELSDERIAAIAASVKKSGR
jgi:hypothetical protein